MYKEVILIVTILYVELLLNLLGFTENKVLKEKQEPAKKGRNLKWLNSWVYSCFFTVFPVFNAQESAEKKAAKEAKAKGSLQLD